MILSELEDEIGRLLGDPSHDRWPLALLDRRINEAQTIVQGYTNAVKTIESLSTTAGTDSVSLDADTMDILKLVITDSSGNAYELEGTTEENLDFDYPNWRNQGQSIPRTFYYRASDQVVKFVPTPDQAYTFSIQEVRKPANVVNASDIPFDSNNQMIPYHMAIVYWVVSQCWMDDGTPEALGRSRFYKTGVMEAKGAGQFEQQIMRILSKFDNPQDIPDHIKWRPTGGRSGSYNYPTKGNPFAGL